MYRSAVILIISLVLAVLLFIVVAQTIVVVELLAVVDESLGAVQVVGAGAARAAQVGMLVRAGERIHTGAGAQAGLHWADGSRIELGPDSDLVVRRCRLSMARHSRQSSFRLNLGEMWIRVRGALEPGSKFEVETPTIVAAVRGTIFHLKVSPDGTTRMQVYRGQVSIVGDGVSQGVPSGESVTVGRGRFDLRRMSAAEQQAWDQRTDIIGPLLEVAEPAPDITTCLPLAPVRGRTEDNVTISINGESVQVSRKGTFRGRARLVEGANVITVVASLDGLRTAVHRSVTYVNPAQQIVITGRPSADPFGKLRAGPGVMGITIVVRDGAGNLVPDGTPLQITADRGTIERYRRTERGVVTTEWQPGAGDQEARITVTCGAAAATTVVSAPSPAAVPGN